MTASDDERLSAIIASFRGIFHNFRRSLASQWLHLDLSMAQMRVLFVLVHHGPNTISALARLLGIGLPTTSHLVERLVRQGLVKRLEDPRDRRQVRVSLTEQGEELTGQFRSPFMQLRGWLLQLSEEDLNALYQGMQALSQLVPAPETLPEPADDELS